MSLHRLRSPGLAIRAALLLGAAVLCPLAWGQSVYKCMVDGKASYQSEPCAGQGKPLVIAPGPSEQEQKDAKQRADAEKMRALSTGSLPETQQQRQYVGQPVNCGQLNQARGEAFGQRNAAVRGSRQSGIDKSDEVNRSLDRILAIESQMRRSGCSPN